jgi:hypothetical protein
VRRRAGGAGESVNPQATFGEGESEDVVDYGDCGDRGALDRGAAGIRRTMAEGRRPARGSQGAGGGGARSGGRSCGVGEEVILGTNSVGELVRPSG